MSISKRRNCCNRLVLTSYLCVFGIQSATAANIAYVSVGQPTSFTFPGSNQAGPGNTVYQQFTLTSPANVTAVDTFLAVFGFPQLAADLSMQILSDSSGLPGSTVLATDTGVTGSLSFCPFPCYEDIGFAFNPTLVAPGTYWLALFNGLSPQIDTNIGWQFGNGANTGVAGDFTDLSGVGTNGISAANGALAATISGVSDVPEPSLWLTSAAALGWMAVRRRFQVSSNRPDIP